MDDKFIDEDDKYLSTIDVDDKFIDEDDKYLSTIDVDDDFDHHGYR